MDQIKILSKKFLKKKSKRRYYCAICIECYRKLFKNNVDSTTLRQMTTTEVLSTAALTAASYQ